MRPYPMVPLAENTALGIAIMSYNGQLNFGLTADRDALADVDSSPSISQVRSASSRDAAGAGSPTRGGVARHAPPRRYPVSSATTALERLAIAVASLLLAFGLIALLSGFFAGRDPAGVVGGARPARGSSSPTRAMPT